MIAGVFVVPVSAMTVERTEPERTAEVAKASA